MDLTHRFTVPIPVDQAWAEFNDIASVAECFPGATVTSAEGDTFQGSVKVKLGPIALVYNGSGTFTEKDEAAHRMVVDAKGKDKRGNGTAGALVTMTMADAGGSTDVEVVTDLAITGKPAQFGRGVMQDVSDKLLGQFVACLEQRFEGSAPTAAAAPPTPPAAEPEPTLTDTLADTLADTSADTSADTLADESAAAAVEMRPPAPTAAAAPVPAPTPVPPPAPAPAATTPGPRRNGDAINLGSTVLPVLVKSYWKQCLVALVVIILVIWLIAAL
jgi:carbon monoxide dehydrogenase subunit G